MRFIVYGVGAIGGTVAAALHRSGQDVVGIARGAQLDAIRADGLRIRTPDEEFTVGLPVVSHPSELTLGADDAILIALKTQHTQGALEALRDIGAEKQPVFCLQNGVANERMALRMFANVHGVTVVMPTTFLTPGEVIVNGTPRHGIFDLGRWPGGADTADHAFAEALNASNIAGHVTEDVASSKYGKLLLNLGNIVGAALGPEVDGSAITEALIDEAKAVYRAAGIGWNDVGMEDPRRKEFLKVREVAGTERAGGSSYQSLARGAGSIETDYLNGEIALLGRLHGCPAPANAAACLLGARLVSEGKGPGSLSVDDLRAALRL